MAESPAISQALTRLESAMRGLESMVDGHSERARTIGDHNEEVYRMGLDRSRLAQSLDEAESRAARLQAANAQVGERLNSAMETLRDVLARHDA